MVEDSRTLVALVLVFAPLSLLSIGEVRRHWPRCNISPSRYTLGSRSMNSPISSPYRAPLPVQGRFFLP